MPSATPWKKDELGGLLPALKHLFPNMSQIIPVVYNHTFNHLFPPEKNVPKAIKYTAFFFFLFFSSFFNLDVHWRSIQQNQQHMKKQRHALPGQECAWTTAAPNPAYTDYNC